LVRARPSGVDLYSIVKELVGTAEPRPRNIVFLVKQERDQGLARGPGGPPYFGAGKPPTPPRLVLCFRGLAGRFRLPRASELRGGGHLAAGFRVYAGLRVVAGLVEALIPGDQKGDGGT
jgi:hypothetical protein